MSFAPGLDCVIEVFSHKIVLGYSHFDLKIEVVVVNTNFTFGGVFLKVI